MADIVSIVDIVLFVIVGFLIFGIIAVVGIIFFLKSQYKHTFIIKNLTGDKPIKTIDKAKEIYDKKTGIYFWKLLNTKHLIGRPPSRALHVDMKGNYIVEAYYLGDINYIYSTEKIDEKTAEKINQVYQDTEEEYKENIIGTLRAKLLETARLNWVSLSFFKPKPVYVYTNDHKSFDSLKDQGGTINTFKPITTNQRLIAYDQIKKAYEKKIKGFEKWAPLVVSIVAIIVLISVMFIFGGELIRPIAELGTKLNENLDTQKDITKSQAEITSLLASIIQERQYFLDEGDNGVIRLLNQTAPS